MGYEVLTGNCLHTLDQIEDESIDTCITSPPYWNLRDYNDEEQIGAESSPELYIQNLIDVFRKVREKLKPEGTLWLNLGDTYSKENYGFVKPKDLLGIPWRVAIALQEDGWWLRQDIIWSKPSCMPESVKDRCTKSHEYIFLLSKNKEYYYDYEAIKEDIVSKGVADSPHSIKAVDGVGGSRDNLHKFKGSDKRNKRSVWTVNTVPYKGAHFAVFPPDLIEPCVLAGSPIGGTVLDPFGGSGTTAGVAVRHNRNAVLCELNEEYIQLIDDRVSAVSGGWRRGQKTLAEWFEGY